MPAVRAITVAVGPVYARTLAICLPKNMRHFTEALIVTTPEDEAVKAVARSVPGVRVFETNAFYEYGAKFNKGYAIELSFDVLGREGWIAVVDADILLPDAVPFDLLQIGHLHGMFRRMLADPNRWHPDLNWQNCPRMRDGGPVGFFHCAHADDPAIKDRRPWYDVSFPHAGGGDARYMRLWPRSHWTMLQCDALHLGAPDRNWFGTSPESRDLMAKFVRRNGWRRAMRENTAEAAARAGELPGRIQVPGFEPSTFELPFVQRAQGETPEHR